jgi:hypothetical protein
MAHRSKKKHLKHVHAQEPPTPPAKSPIAKAEAAAAGIAKKASHRRRATEPKPKQRPGLVRRIAGRASEAIERVGKLRRKVAAKPKRVLSRAKARVKARVKARMARTRTAATEA